MDGRYNEEDSKQMVNMDSSFDDIIHDLQQGETLVLDVGDSKPWDTDEIYDKLVMQGYNVKKSFLNGRQSIIVSR